MQQPVYISLGSDCSVSYQLRKCGLQTASMPFDWLKIDNLDSIISILQNNFKDFVAKQKKEKRFFRVI